MKTRIQHLLAALLIVVASIAYGEDASIGTRKGDRLLFRRRKIAGKVLDL